MNSLEFEYKVSIEEFRQAYHYGMMSRNRIGFRMFAIVMLAMILYGFLVVSTLLPLNYFVLFIGGAELLWALWMFADAERKIFKYVRSAESMVGVPYEVTIESHRISFEVPSRNVSGTFAYKDLPCVIELSRIFMIYADTQELFILPIRYLREEQLAEFRETLTRRVGENYISQRGRDLGIIGKIFGEKKK